MSKVEGLEKRRFFEWEDAGLKPGRAAPTRDLLKNGKIMLALMIASLGGDVKPLALHVSFIVLT